MKIYADFYAESLIYAEFALKNARRAIITRKETRDFLGKEQKMTAIR